MKISDVLEYCELVMAQYGNLEAIVFTETNQEPNFTFNEPILELLSIPISRFEEKQKLVVGFGFGKDINFEEDNKIKAKAKFTLRLVK